MVASDMVDRPEALQRIRRALDRARVVALIGPRQCGKTTLARQLLPARSPNYFDLEDPTSLAQLGPGSIADMDGVRCGPGRGGLGRVLAAAPRRRRGTETVTDAYFPTVTDEKVAGSM